MTLEKIIIGIEDDEEITAKIVDFTDSLACKNAQVILVNIIKEPTLLSDALKDKAEEIYIPLSADLLNKTAKNIKAGGYKNVETVSIVGSPAEEILKLAKEKKADAIIVGSHSKSAVAEFLVGSVSSNLLHHAKCTIIVVR